MELTPSDASPRPIALSRRGAGNELLEHHRRLALPRAGQIAVVGNARLGTAARPRQNDKATTARQQLGERLPGCERGHALFCHRHRARSDCAAMPSFYSRGIPLMLTAVAVFSLMDASLKQLTGAYPPS